jgi:diacylglycerol kinase family enzyme
MRRVAVLLNRNAQRVTPGLVRLVQSMAPPGTVLVTTTLDEGRAAATAVARGRYEALCVGGGDGTFTQAVRDLLDVAPERVPVLMPLRLGTGNAISDVCGASPPTREGLAADIARAAGDEPPGTLDLLDVDGGVTHFTGIGLDARYAEDHRRIIKDGLRKGRFGRLFDGVFGHALAAAVGTVPRLLREPRPAVRIVNDGTPAYRLDDDGRFAGAPIPAGGVLYEGEITLAAASTISHYSSGIVFFPFVEGLRGRFQLRVSSAGLLEFLPNLPAVFAGTYRNPRCLWDFAATSVRFEMPLALPYHVGGDVQPARRGFAVRLAARSVPLLRGVNAAT